LDRQWDGFPLGIASGIHSAIIGLHCHRVAHVLYTLVVVFQRVHVVRQKRQLAAGRTKTQADEQVISGMKANTALARGRVGTLLAGAEGKG
jgi:hypothetical protein